MEYSLTDVVIASDMMMVWRGQTFHINGRVGSTNEIFSQRRKYYSFDHGYWYGAWIFHA